MHPVLVVGAGNVGSLIALLLAHSNQYQVFLGDLNQERLNKLKKHRNLHTLQFDINDEKLIAEFMAAHQVEAVIACLPYFCSLTIAKLADQYAVHYFDLTEDVAVVEAVKILAKNKTKAFVPGCGLAPGFIDIVAHTLASTFDEIDIIKLRAGGLPVNASNALQYALTWSTDGLINEYGNMCYGIVDGKMTPLLPLEGLELVDLDGTCYEAFNTSGGVGSLIDTYLGKANTLNYKTLRYPGHRDKIAFLMKDLRLNNDRETLKQIFEAAMPSTNKDVMIIYVSVTGRKNGKLIEENYLNKVYGQQVVGQHWSAIQVTTASCLCAVLDRVLNDADQYHGLVRQEQFSLADVITNQFGALLSTE